VAGVNVKMGVSGVNEFKRSMNESKEAVRTLNEALKANEAQLKLTGDEEAYAERQASTLKAMIEAQKSVFDNATKALQEMDRQGVDPASASFQKMQQQALRAQTDLNKMQLELRNIESGAEGATGDTREMNQELQQIGKNVSFQTLKEGLDGVVSKLESGARAAINFGKRIMRYVSSSAEWADELKTTSQQTGYSVEELQRMEIVADTVDTSVDAIITAQNRMKKAASTSGGKNAIEELLGINLNGQSPDDLFWEIGDALLHMENAYDQEQAAQSVFGRSWRDLVPLFLTGRDAYEQMLEEADQFILSEESVNKLGEVNDALDMAENRLEQIKNQFIADNADKILELLEWFVNNYETVVNGLIAIGAAIAAMKIGQFVLDLGEMINGFKTLGLAGGGGAAAAGGGGGAVAGGGGGLAAFGTAFKSAAKGIFSGGGLWALAPAAVYAAATLPARLANNWNFAQEEERFARIAESAEMLGGQAGEFLNQANQALGFQRGSNGQISSNLVGGRWWGDQAMTYDILMGMSSRSDIQKAQLANLLYGTSTSQGNDTWLELQRLWKGEEFDSARETSLLLAVTEAYDRMARVQEQTTGTGSTTGDRNSLTSNDIANFNGLPGQIARAVENANIRIYIDGALAGASVAPYVNTAMGGMIKGYTK